MKRKLKKVQKILQNGGAIALARAIARSLTSRFRITDSERAFHEIGAIAVSGRSSTEKFSAIYDKKLWVRVNPAINADKSLSGQGSTLESTAVFRQQLEHFVSQIDAKRVLDIPCGDFNWMGSVKFPVGLEYIGGDIVPTLVARLNKSYARNDPVLRRSFRAFDITNEPFGVADLWLCKDCVQHLSNNDILLALANFSRSSVDYALISNHTDVQENTDIPTGHFRHVDLTLPPFNLPMPLMKLSDTPVDHEPRYIGVWKREDMAAKFAR